ncbi:hypothetical protein SISSUDRAFT_967603, partial [Sistotremastrum suecicum HHB10207 ss-3]
SQGISHTDDVAFRNALLSMRPHTLPSELPSAHELSIYIHNQFLDLIHSFKHEFSVSESARRLIDDAE